MRRQKVYTPGKVNSSTLLKFAPQIPILYILLYLNVCTVFKHSLSKIMKVLFINAVVNTYMFLVANNHYPKKLLFSFANVKFRE